jgi:hypothetical protein
MNSYLISDLARTTIEQRHADAAAYHRARLARRATANAAAFLSRVANRPRVPAQRRPEQADRQGALVGGGRVRG